MDGLFPGHSSLEEPLEDNIDQLSNTNVPNEQYIQPQWLDASASSYGDWHLAPYNGHLSHVPIAEQNFLPRSPPSREIHTPFSQWPDASRGHVGGNDYILGDGGFASPLLEPDTPLYFDFQAEPQFEMTESNNTNIQPHPSYLSSAPLSPELPQEQAGVLPPVEQRTTSKRLTRQPAWGTLKTNHQRQPSMSSSSNSKAQSKSKNATAPSDPPRRRSSRSIQSARNTSSSAVADDTKKGRLQDRAAHNIIEKQYRNRLNDQYETLLRALPQDTNNSEIDDEEVDATTSEEKVSKAEVLVSARRYIKKLEKEENELMASNSQLAARKGELEKAWIGMGGMPMP